MRPHGTCAEYQKLKFSVHPLALGQPGPPCSALDSDAVENQHQISHFHGEGVAWPTCDSVMCGGLGGSGKHSWLKLLFLF